MSLTMFTNSDPNENLLNAPNTISAANKRWHSAFVTINCSRVLKSRFSHYKTKTEISPTQSSSTVVDSNSHHSFDFDQTRLTNLVEEKDLQSLNEFGGIEGVAARLGTSIEYGIKGHDDNGGDEDIAHRKQEFGSNTYNKPPSKGFLHFVVEAMDFTTVLLFYFGMFTLAVGIKEDGPKEGWCDGGSIMFAVFNVIFFSSISKFKQNRRFEKLSQVNNDIQIDVVRSARLRRISIFEIVVGDVICLRVGDQVPADGLFIGGHSLRIDESSMTGESDLVEINRHSRPFLFSGTQVADGYGKMLVTSVGMNTKWGQMMSSTIRVMDKETPLQARVNKLASLFGKGGLVMAFISVVILADSATIVVEAIAEGLPLGVTLTLAYSMEKMMTDQAMVRKLSACETMGSATIICTDKTGTLTLNQMKVTEFWPGLEPVVESAYSNVAPFVLQLIQEGVALNTTGSVHKSNESDSKFEFSGSPTEKAILSWVVSDFNMEMDHLRRSCSIIHVETFNSERKRSGVLVRRKVDSTVNAHWKGAAEMVLKMCSRYYDASGVVKDLDNDIMINFERIIEGMAAKSLRCMAFAHAQVGEDEFGVEGGNTTVKDNGLTLLGLVGIKDPCRPGLKNAVEECQRAGVDVKMITGDNVFTAKAIATECGILRHNQQDTVGAVVKGEEFRNYTRKKRLEKVDNICVMARASPSDKLLMVQCLKQKGHVVAVTGDGTNDAPALKEADIGLFMGIQGTQVAKESSDILILDGGFASVVKVLMWGRCVYNNIQKFIQFQFTLFIAILAINLVAGMSTGNGPLKEVQLLWVNLIMDTFASWALATEKPTGELMDEPPVDRTKPLITNIMWRNILAQALYQIAVLLTLQFKGESIFGVKSEVNSTLKFNTFVLCQVFNEFNARKMEKMNVFKGIHRSKLFMGIIGGTIVIQVVMVEFVNKYTNAKRLNWEQWGICIGLAAISWPIGWIVKLIPVP